MNDGNLSLNKVKLYNLIITKLYSDVLETMNFVEVYFRVMEEVRFFDNSSPTIS